MMVNMPKQQAPPDFVPGIVLDIVPKP